MQHSRAPAFPFLFGGTFIEGPPNIEVESVTAQFPFLFGGTFIEGHRPLRLIAVSRRISLPFRRDFH